MVMGLRSFNPNHCRCGALGLQIALRLLRSKGLAQLLRRLRVVMMAEEAVAGFKKVPDNNEVGFHHSPHKPRKFSGPSEIINHHRGKKSRIPAGPTPPANV